MFITETPDFDDHELVVTARDAQAGLTAIIAVHSTVAGPACGGTRMWPYATGEEAAIDALRLSKGMTYKNVMAGLALGGGKSVIIGDSRTQKSEALLRAFGRKVEALGGRYVCAEDVGTSPCDMEIIRRETRHVAGLDGGAGDPSPTTAFGVYHGIKATAARLFAGPQLTGRSIAVQGLGHVGRALCGHLAAEAARLIVSDIDEERVREMVDRYGATAVAPDAIHAVPCDIFSPCALGAGLNARTIPQLACKGVAGAANNQLSTDDMAGALTRRRILYAPDYIINAAGVILVAGELAGAADRDAALERARKIGETLTHIFERAEKAGETTAAVADQMARERLASLAESRKAA